MQPLLITGYSESILYHLTHNIFLKTYLHLLTGLWNPHPNRMVLQLCDLNINLYMFFPLHTFCSLFHILNSSIFTILFLLLSLYIKIINFLFLHISTRFRFWYAVSPLPIFFRNSPISVHISPWIQKLINI